MQSLASFKQKNFLQNENRIINKKVMGVWGSCGGKWLWEFYTSNGTEMNFTVEFLAQFLQKSIKMHETWPPYVFRGEDFKYFCVKSNFFK